MNKEVEEEGGYSFQNWPMPSVAWAIHNCFERIVGYLLTLSGKDTLFIFSGLDRYMSTYVRTSKLAIFQKYIFYYFSTYILKICILLMDVDLYFFASYH